MKPKILIIGLDAATMDLIEPWSEAGKLPVISSVMREGASARLLSTPNMHSASAWTSILTGLNPGRHGLYVFSDRDFATGRQQFFKGGDRAGDLITSHLARHEMTSGLLNVPMTYPASCAPGGYTISGLDAPALGEKAFCPRELREEIFTRFPDYNFAPAGIGDLMSAGRITDAISEWKKLIEIQTQAALHLMESRPVDFFMTVYTASDWGGHNLWKYTEFHPDSKATGRGESNELGGALESIYSALDEAVGQLIERAGEGAQVYIISDHGMGPHSGASYHLAAWLEEKGYMVRKSHGQSRASLMNAGRRAAKRILPAAVKERLKSSLSAETIKSLQTAEKDSFHESIDWEKTVAYAEPGRHVINLNLSGRNKDGRVSPEDYERVCAALIEELSGWTDPSGERAVERVARRSEAYEGPFLGRASDLYVYWNTSARFGEPPPEVRARGFWWSGDHRPEGILICKGPGIRQTSQLNLPVVYDLVPTVMYLAGLPVPSDLDGRVIEEACAESFIASHPLRVESPRDGASSERGDLSSSEEEMIEEKLRGLGYL